MTQAIETENTASTHFYEDTRWRLLSNTLWNGLILVILAIVLLLGSVTSESFWASANLQSILWAWLTAALLVPSMSLIVASGGLDLSVGSVAGLTAVIMASLAASGKTGIGVALMLGLCLAFLVGLVNGFLIGVVKLNSVMVTLAMMTLLRGISYFITQNVIVVADAGFLASPALPAVVLIVLVAACIAATELGGMRNKTGSSPAPEVSWIRHSLRLGLPYLLSATVAGFVGALYLARLRAATPAIGTGLEFDVILITFLGGTPFGSGFVNIVGGILAALLIATAQNIAMLNGTSTFSIMSGKGLALLLFGPLCHAYYYVVDLIFRNMKKPAAPPQTENEPLPKTG